MNRWQPCNGEAGNPVGRRVSNLSPVDFSTLNRIFYRFYCLYHHFYGNKLKNINIWQPCNGETGNPVGRWVSKMSPIDSSLLNRGLYQF